MMPRAKSYDRAEALRAVRDAFWELGYDGLSVAEIEARTGLNRFAIRTEFGGKEELFLAALADYSTETETYVLGPLEAEGGVDQIVAVLREIAAPHENSMRRFGCLMVNTTIANAIDGSEPVRGRTNAHWQRLNDAFRCALEIEDQKGSLRGDVDIHDAAHFLVGAIIAATVINRDSGRSDAAKGQIAITIDTVRRWQRKAD